MSSFCPSCRGNDHQRSSSKKCPNYNPTQNKTSPEDNTYKADFRVYKTGFQKLCRFRYKDKLLREVNRLVRQCTQLCFEVTNLIQLYSLYILERRYDHFGVGPREFHPDFLRLNENFFRMFFIVIRDGENALVDDDVLFIYRHCYTVCLASTYKRPDLKGAGEIITYLVKEYLVNLSLHLDKQYCRLFSHYLKYLFISVWSLPKQEARNYISLIMNETEPEFISEEDTQIRDLRQEFISRNDDISEKLTYIYRRSIHNYRRNGLSTQFQNSYNGPTCDIVPLYSMAAKYITIDTKILYSMLGRKKALKHEENEAMRNQSRFWKRAFKIPNDLLRSQVDKPTFAFTIKTDGMGVSVCYFTWKKKDEEIARCETKEEKAALYKDRREQKEARIMEELRSIAKLPQTRWKSIDPGAKSVMTVLDEYNNDFQHFSINRYYTESGFRYATRKLRSLMLEVEFCAYKDIIRWQSKIPSIKSLDFSVVTHYIEYMMRDEGCIKIIDLRCTNKVKRLRWKTYIMNQKTVQNFAKEILEGAAPELTIICFGDANWTNLKGRESSPRSLKYVKVLRRMRCHVYMTNEFNTSQICSKCRNHKRLEGCTSARNSYTIRRCSEKSCRMIWNRDVNASINILEVGRGCILSGTKPEIFSKRLPPRRT